MLLSHALSPQLRDEVIATHAMTESNSRLPDLFDVKSRRWQNGDLIGCGSIYIAWITP